HALFNLREGLFFLYFTEHFEPQGHYMPTIKFSGSKLENVAYNIKKRVSDMPQIRHNNPI
ncbi:MAG: hypothetical protein MJZ22_04445, partial [Candidatus Saccharibacteria bacterium]|nr:hypothetical protein [Candidatus Saccharibacteria bacterium]